eukprot:408346-Amphidinium_carterae.1
MAKQGHRTTHFAALGPVLKDQQVMPAIPPCIPITDRNRKTRYFPLPAYIGDRGRLQERAEEAHKDCQHELNLSAIAHETHLRKQLETTSRVSMKQLSVWLSR